MAFSVISCNYNVNVEWRMMIYLFIGTKVYLSSYQSMLHETWNRRVNCDMQSTETAHWERRCNVHGGESPCNVKLTEDLGEEIEKYPRKFYLFLGIGYQEFRIQHSVILLNSQSIFCHSLQNFKVILTGKRQKAAWFFNLFLNHWM